MECRGKRSVIIISADRYQERAMTEADRRRWNSMQLYMLLQKMEAGELPVVLRDGCIWGYEMDVQELEQACEKAWSFPDLHPPNNARYIGYQRHPTGRYLYWKDSDGKYWYDTERGMVFKRSMEEVQKKKKMASRRTWMPG